LHHKIKMLFVELPRVVYLPILAHWLVLDNIPFLDCAQTNHGTKNRHLRMLENERFNFETPGKKKAYKSFLVWAIKKKIKIRSFTLKNNVGKFIKSDESLATIFEGVEVLNVHWNSVAEQLIYFGDNRLKQLVINGNKVPADALLNVVSKHQGLEFLHIMSPVEFYVQTIANSVEKMPKNSNIKSFVCQSQHLPSGLLSNLLQLCPNITELNIKNGVSLTHKSFEHLIKNPSKLQEVELENCTNLQSDTVVSILSHCPDPRCVYLNDSSHVDSEVISTILNTPSFGLLERLSLTVKLANLQADFVSLLVSHCPLLKHLSLTRLTGGDRVVKNDRNLFNFARDVISLKHIEWLHIDQYTCDYTTKQLSVDHSDVYWQSSPHSITIDELTMFPKDIRIVSVYRISKDDMHCLVSAYIATLMSVSLLGSSSHILSDSGDLELLFKNCILLETLFIENLHVADRSHVFSAAVKYGKSLRHLTLLGGSKREQFSDKKVLDFFANVAHRPLKYFQVSTRGVEGLTKERLMNMYPNVECVF
jgi:hypothetical protein